ncbi:MAG: FlgD immunoglobulin-like domain containing protein [Candidatus Eisenbacteria bacterium]
MRRLFGLAVLLGALWLPAESRAVPPVRIALRFQHPTAGIVNLAGTFNGWCDASGGSIDTAIDPMNGPDAEGWWTLEKLLEPGDYEYKFVADGHLWFTDPLNPRVDYGEYGNSMFTVGDPAVYYLLPNAMSAASGPRPQVSADLGKSDAAAWDLDELRIYLDGALVSAGPDPYDPIQGRVHFTPADSLAEGLHDLRIEAALVGGAGGADSSEFLVVVDGDPPAIAHVPPAQAPAHAPLHISAEITDDRGVEASTLEYRLGAAGAWLEVAMQAGLGDDWIGTIPAGAAAAGGTLHYAIEARDLVNLSRAPQSGSYAVAIGEDLEAPVVSEAFASPATLDPGGEDDQTRLSFYLSEPAEIAVQVLNAGGLAIRTLASGEARERGYHSFIWDGRTGAGVQVAAGEYVFEIGALDPAGLTADPRQAPLRVQRGAPAAPLKVVLLFHANQNLNYQGDTANDVCFHGLLDVLRRHPQSKFAVHFSGTLLHDIGWLDLRHDPSSLDLLRDGFADGQFEIIGSTYAQNVPYATHMWDNERQLEVHRETIERCIGAQPSSFWNAERCWKQALVPLMADHGYRATWVESHILWDSGASAPEHAVRKTALGDQEVVAFNDDSEMIWLLDGAIDSGNANDLIGYLSWLRSQDTWRDWVVCYAQDAEASGLWDYEGGGNPQEDWDHLEQVLTALENTGWIELTTFADVLASRFPTEEVSPIVDGQANWMVGPSQQAGYRDWFDYNARSPLLAAYRDFYDGLRARIREVEARVLPGTPAANLVKHAIWNMVAHQFEFGCIGCGGFACQDWQKAETLEGALLAAETSLAPPAQATLSQVDANGDGTLDWVLANARDLFIISPTGGRLLRWFDLVHGEEISGNELFMWGFYYVGYGGAYGGPGHNDDRHYMSDVLWNAPYPYPAAQPHHRTYRVRKHAFNDRLSVDGGDDDLWLDVPYAAAASGDTLRLEHTGDGLRLTKSWTARDSCLEVLYRITNLSAQPHDYVLVVENELNPGLLEVMNQGRGTLAYWDGGDTSAVLTPAAVGVANVLTGRAVRFGFSESPAGLAGGETVHGLLFSPRFEIHLGPGESRELRISVGVATAAIPADEDSVHPIDRLSLASGFPNPFIGSTRIRFDLPATRLVDLSLFDLLGRRVRTLLHGVCAPDRYSVDWDGTLDGGHPAAAGLYLCRLRAGDEERTRKLLFLK